MGKKKLSSIKYKLFIYFYIKLSTQSDSSSWDPSQLLSLLPFFLLKVLFKLAGSKAWCHHWQLPPAPCPQKCVYKRAPVHTHTHTHAHIRLLHPIRRPYVGLLHILSSCLHPVNPYCRHCNSDLQHLPELPVYKVRSESAFGPTVKFPQDRSRHYALGYWVYGIQGQFSEAITCGSIRRVLRKILWVESSHKGTRMQNLRSEELRKRLEEVKSEFQHRVV